jgi:hypothetical protein
MQAHFIYKDLGQTWVIICVCTDIKSVEILRENCYSYQTTLRNITSVIQFLNQQIHTQKNTPLEFY